MICLFVCFCFPFFIPSLFLRVSPLRSVPYTNSHPETRSMCPSCTLLRQTDEHGLTTRFSPLLVYFCIGSRRGSLNVQFPFFHAHPSPFTLPFYIYSSSFFRFFDSTTLRMFSIISRVSLYWWIVYAWLLRSNSKSDSCNSIRKLFLWLHLSSSVLLILLLLFHYTFDKFHSEWCNIFHVEGTVYVCVYNWSLKCDSSCFPPPPPPPPTSVVYRCVQALNLS